MFTTAEHALDVEQRNERLEVALPITIGNNVWIGAGTTVLGGVTIGDNTVIGAGRTSFYRNFERKKRLRN